MAERTRTLLLRPAMITILLGGLVLGLLCGLLLPGCAGTPPVAAGDDGPGGSDGAMCASQCGNRCVDTTSDPENCGGCGNACESGWSCQAGLCQPPRMGGNPDAGGGPGPGSVDMSVPPPPPPPVVMHACDAAPPAGAHLPAPPPKYSGGTCPSIMKVTGRTAIKSGSSNRSFLLAVPKDLRPEERLPVVFMWHWLGGSAEKFYEKGEVQQAVDSQRFLAVIPDAKGDLVFKWPFDVADGILRMAEEYKFFDDMLACVAQQFNVSLNCVSTAGVSAGALFTDQLAAARSQYLASGISLSGGVGGSVRPWGDPPHKLPMLVLWGGPLDICIVINFATESHNLEAALTAQGDFLIECIHNCRHGEPPFDAPMGLSKYAGLWQFAFDHPFWLPPGDSPYKATGLPNSLPPWCAIGAGKAKPRTGSCPPPGC